MAETSKLLGLVETDAALAPGKARKEDGGDSTHRCLESDNVRKATAERRDHFSRGVTTRECVAAALKVGRYPDMQGSRVARKRAQNEKNAGETFLNRRKQRYTRPLTAGCPGT